MNKVAAALIKKKGKYLIARRTIRDENVLGKWELTGGKFQKVETEDCAIERKTKEKFEMCIIVFFANNVSDYPKKKTIDLRLYKCKYLSVEFYLHGHSEYQFVDENEIIKFDLCPADIPLVKYIKKLNN